MMKKVNLLFIILIAFQSIFSQVSKEVKLFSKKLDTISYAEGSHIGIGGEPSEVFSYFQEVNSIASNEELFHFAKNGSNSLRLYSSQSLVDRKDIDKINFIYSFYLMHPIKISYLSGCSLYNLSITETIRKRLKFVEHVIEDDVRKKLDEREKKLTNRLKNDNLSLDEKESCRFMLIELKRQKQWFKNFGNWTKTDLKTITENLNKLDIQFKEHGFILLR